MARRTSENPIAQLGQAFHDAYSDLRAEYRLGSTGRFLPRPRGVAAQGSNADYHWRDPNRYYLAIERARDWDRNNLVVGAGIDRVRDNVWGEEGPIVQPTTPDPELNKALAERFYAWADDADAVDLTGTDNFWQMSAGVLRSSLIDGDQLGVPLIDGQIQLYEAHRMKTPRNTDRRMVHGVLLNEFNKPLQYWVTREDVGVMAQVQRVGDMVKIDARDDEGNLNAFFPRHRKRGSQTRGVSPLAPVADAVGLHDDIQFAALVKQQVVNCFGILRELAAPQVGVNPPPAPQRGSAGDKPVGERTTQARGDGTSDILESLRPGMDVRGLPGEKISAFSSNVPGESFFPHAMLVLTFISINIGIPVAVLLLDPSNTNFSGWRGAIDEARKGFRRLQRWKSSQWLTPVYGWKLRQFAAEDSALRSALARHKHKFFSHEWHCAGWDYIEPLKDAQADLLQIRNALTSQRRRCAKRNIVWSDLAKEIVEDNALIIRLAKQQADKLNGELKLDGPAALTWRELACLPTPDGMQIKLDPNAADASQSAPQKGAA